MSTVEIQIVANNGNSGILLQRERDGLMSVDAFEIKLCYNRTSLACPCLNMGPCSRCFFFLIRFVTAKSRSHLNHLSPSICPLNTSESASRYFYCYCSSSSRNLFIMSRTLSKKSPNDHQIIIIILYTSSRHLL